MKEREIYGVKVVVSGETFDEYKGTLQDQLEEKDKEIDKLNNIIDKAIDKLYCYGEVFDREILKQFQKEMLEILQGDDKE